MRRLLPLFVTALAVLGLTWVVVAPLIGQPVFPPMTVKESDDSIETTPVELSFDSSDFNLTESGGSVSVTATAGAGTGDSVEVEDGDNLGTFTGIDTTARFDDSSDINFIHGDGGAGGPDLITGLIKRVDLEGITITGIASTEIPIGQTGPDALIFATLSGDVTLAANGAVTIAANSVALTTDTTGNYAAGNAEAGDATSLAADALDAITEMAVGVKSGADTTVVTGTAGINGNCAQWNVDGDLVDAGGVCGGSPALNDVTDVTITTPATGAVLIKSAGDWVDGAVDLADADAVTGVLADANIVGNHSHSTNTVSDGAMVDTHTHATDTVSDAAMVDTHTHATDSVTDLALVDAHSHAADSIDAITEIAAALKTGADLTLTTGTPGVSGNCVEWNVDGDLVDAGAACGTGGAGAFSDAGDPIVQNTTTKDVHVGAGAGTLAGKLEVGGDADQPQVVIECFSTQTDDCVIVQDSTDTEVFTVSAAGAVTAASSITATVLNTGPTPAPTLSAEDSSNADADADMTITIVDNASNDTELNINVEIAGALDTWFHLDGLNNDIEIGDTTNVTTLTMLGTSGLVVENNLTVGDGAGASQTITGDVSGTDTVITLGSGVVNVSTGTLQQGGVAVQTGTDDDVPESGDFGNAGALDADGTLSNDAVAALADIAQSIKTAANDTDPLAVYTGGNPGANVCVEMNSTGQLIAAADTCANLGPGGTTSYENIADPAAAGLITFGDGETATYDGANDDETFITISLSAADLVGDTEALLITAVDNDDANYIPLLIQDDQDGTPDTLFSIDFQGNVTAAGTVTATDVVAGSSVVADAEVDDDITLTNLTQVTNRAISDTTGTLAVARGGTGSTTLTDGGILLGSGTGPITALGVATNGQIPIGDGTTDPVLATISASANETTVTNGAGTVTIGLVASPTIGGGNITALSGTNISTGTVDEARLDANVMLDSETVLDSIAWLPGGIGADGTQCADATWVTIGTWGRKQSIICTDNDAATMTMTMPAMPDSWDAGTVTLELEYIQDAADTSALNMDVAGRCAGEGETPAAYGTEVAMDDAAVVGSDARDTVTSAAITLAGTCVAGDEVQLQVQIDATGTTTAVATLNFIGAKLEFTKNLSGD